MHRHKLSDTPLKSPKPNLPPKRSRNKQKSINVKSITELRIKKSNSQKFHRPTNSTLSLQKMQSPTRAVESMYMICTNTTDPNNHEAINQTNQIMRKSLAEVITNREMDSSPYYLKSEMNYLDKYNHQRNAKGAIEQKHSLLIMNDQLLEKLNQVKIGLFK